MAEEDKTNSNTSEQGCIVYRSWLILASNSSLMDAKVLIASASQLSFPSLLREDYCILIWLFPIMINPSLNFVFLLLRVNLKFLTNSSYVFENKLKVLWS